MEFLLKKNGMALPGLLLASLRPDKIYYPPPLDITLFLRMPFAAQIPMSPVGETPNSARDFDRCAVNAGPGPAGLRLYFQGAVFAITASDPIAPIDLSEPVQAN